MISHVEIDGFRSLSKFSISLRPGVNVLVGPNGAGKTNILSFFEFLQYLVTSELPEAISRMGGAGSVFRKTGEVEYQSTLTATVYGSLEINSKKYIQYKYCFCIEFPESRDTLFFKNQSLCLKARTVKATSQPKKEDWDFEIIEETPNEKTTVRISKFTEKFAKEITIYIPGNPRAGLKKEGGLIEFLSRMANDYTSVLSRLTHIIEFKGSHLLSDFMGGTIFNIVPSKARSEEDVAKRPLLAKDGTGIYSTLYAVDKMEAQKEMHRVFRSFYSERYLRHMRKQDILAGLRLANPAITNYSVHNDTFNNKLQVRIQIAGEGENTGLPLAAMSDGTIKWLALLLIIKANTSMLSVEEPENYLHPSMQTEFLSFLRGATTIDRAALLSTHSESILNACQPEEVIVVSFEDGKTNASRPENASILRGEISNTGFGLGYYYVTGALDPIHADVSGNRS